MHKKLSITPTATFLILCAAILIPSTATAQTTTSARTSPTIQPAASGGDCTIVNQRLEKTLAALNKSETEKKADENTIAALLKLDAANNALSAAKDATIQSKEDENKILRAIKCSTTSFVFGLIKKKTCY